MYICCSLPPALPLGATRNIYPENNTITITNMGWLDKLFGKKEETTGATFSAGNPDLRFGRYSDNNKSVAKTNKWYEAEDLFKAKNYQGSIAAFFSYLRDDAEDNVSFSPRGDAFSFEFYQGSKRIFGSCDGRHITAEVPVVKMNTPSAAVMRRMLELNFGLFYSRTALNKDNVLSMIFETPVEAANPNKLYYGLKELATKADRQDDTLVADFKMLEAVDTGHVRAIPDAELEVKYTYFRKWIEEALQRVATLNQDSFSGSIAYLLLNTLYRIDYLIAPEAKLLADLEHINSIYWTKKEEVPIIDRNQMMQDELRKLLSLSKEDFAKNVYRSKATFAIANPPKMEKAKETVENSNRDSYWYIENKHPDLALVLNEYGLSYNQYTFSMPDVLTELYHIYMMVMHAAYFEAVGGPKKIYDPATNQFNKGWIQQRILQITGKHREKFPYLNFDAGKLRFDSLYNFGISFSEQMAELNLDPRKN